MKTLTIISHTEHYKNADDGIVAGDDDVVPLLSSLPTYTLS